MEHKIIYTRDYALIVSDEKINPGDIKYNEKSMFFPVVKCTCTCPHDETIPGVKKVIAHRPLADALILEGVPLLPEFGEKLEILNSLEEICNTDENLFSAMDFLSYRVGYDKAKETYIKILKSIESLCDNQNPAHKDILRLCHSVQQTKRPKYFEYETEEGLINQQTKLNDWGVRPKIALNSQGQAVLVGTYKGGEQC